ncbi:MAG: DNA mismatch repair protein MutS [Candidatus Alcyoniella australis]|nr:DNA mismatch repair protein MutS [Candidatus Alcyoniella australis]
MAPSAKVKITPMLRQYFEVKEQYADSILLFRMGDFYEMFFDDAVEASKILNIALTKRGRHDDQDVPLCGVPYHSISGYISKLIRAGKRVAICEQVEDPKLAKGIVKRRVIRVVTPGLVIDESDLDERSNNFLMAVCNPGDDCWGFAYIDVSTGTFRAGQVTSLDQLADEASRIEPAEILVPDSLRTDPLLTQFTKRSGAKMVNVLGDQDFDPERARAAMRERFGAPGDELPELPQAGLAAAAAVLVYLQQTQMVQPDHVRRLTVQRFDDYMVLDESTIRNLELLYTAVERRRRGSLLGLLDKTSTAMGGRKLRRWLTFPLANVDKIVQRHEALEQLCARPDLLDDLRRSLDGICDLERAVGRLSLNSGNARDLLNLKLSLWHIPAVVSALGDGTAGLLLRLGSAIDPADDIAREIDETIVDEPPLALRDGGLIKPGVDPQLDELRQLSGEGRGWIAALESQERRRTSINSLKVRYNKVFGYYIEVTKPNLHLVPDDYERKQTLANCERFVTPELKQMELKVLGADERSTAIEYEIFERLRKRVAAQSGRILACADLLAEVDVLAALAACAVEYGYVRPTIDDSNAIDIEGGRHPVVERALSDERFVPNDVLLDCQENQILIITGPNMAGKSTYIRQVALIVLMAQIGSFVPATRARIGICDRIFTRVGASDNLARGLSTFMVEMTETANILANATPRSLVVLDEIGRGTSTFDGISIAWAVAEQLHDAPGLGCRSLFATHYHELTELKTTKQRVRNLNVAVREWQDTIIFLRRIQPGPASRSYGIQVARLAGLPLDLINRAKEILTNLERGEYDEAGMPRLARPRGRAQRNPDQLALFAPEVRDEHPVLQQLEQLDPTTLSPLEALNLLFEIKAKLKGDQQ